VLLFLLLQLQQQLKQLQQQLLLQLQLLLIENNNAGKRQKFTSTRLRVRRMLKSEHHVKPMRNLCCVDIHRQQIRQRQTAHNNDSEVSLHIPATTMVETRGQIPPQTTAENTPKTHAKLNNPILASCSH